MNTRPGSTARVVYQRPHHVYKWRDIIRTVMYYLPVSIPEASGSLNMSADDALDMLAMYVCWRRIGAILSKEVTPNQIAFGIAGVEEELSIKISKIKNSTLQSQYYATLRELHDLTTADSTAVLIRIALEFLPQGVSDALHLIEDVIGSF
jgi:hypothetical protein